MARLWWAAGQRRLAKKDSAFRSTCGRAANGAACPPPPPLALLPPPAPQLLFTALLNSIVLTVAMVAGTHEYLSKRRAMLTVLRLAAVWSPILRSHARYLFRVRAAAGGTERRAARSWRPPSAGLPSPRPPRHALEHACWCPPLSVALR